MIPAVIEPFASPYMQRALLELVMLGVIGGVLGSWIVLRGLAFYTHAVGTAAFPGLVVAGSLGIPAPLAALGCGFGLAGVVSRLAGGRRLGQDAATGIALVGALALGVVLASDVVRSGAGVDRLLFGSLIGLSDLDLWLTAAVAVATVCVAAAARRTWLATGFDPEGAQALGVRAAMGDWLLLALVSLAVVAALDAVGALLVAVVFVVPAATVRLGARSVTQLQLGATALCVVEGVVALRIAHALDVGPGPALALVGGTTFALAAGARAVRA